MKRTTTHWVNGLMSSSDLGIIPAELSVRITNDDLGSSLSIADESPAGIIMLTIPLEPIIQRLREVIK